MDHIITKTRHVSPQPTKAASFDLHTLPNQYKDLRPELSPTLESIYRKPRAENIRACRHKPFGRRRGSQSLPPHKIYPTDLPGAERFSKLVEKSPLWHAVHVKNGNEKSVALMRFLFLSQTRN